MQPVPIIGQRQSTRSYIDPVEAVWIGAAKRMGLTVRRAGDVYASYDGAGTLCFGTGDALDADDCLAQMILHEICHWITNGEQAYNAIDWGFEPTEHVDWKEYPAIRLQAWLTRPHGLWQLLGPTTDVRPYYDQLSDSLIALNDSEDERRIAARTVEAAHRAQQPRWWPHLQAALLATAHIREATFPFVQVGDTGDLWASPSALFIC